MPSFFLKLFSRTRTTSHSANAKAPAPVTPIAKLYTANKKTSAPIPYRFELTDNLKNEHQELLALVHAILKTARAGQYAALNVKIHQFETSFKAHLGEEFRELYVLTEYLINRCESARDTKQLRNFRQEIQVLGGQIINILHKYNTTEIAENHLKHIVTDFSEISTNLAARFQREENLLFPLYDTYGAEYASATAKKTMVPPVPYCPGLVESLKCEHQQLLALHGAVLQAAQSHDYNAIDRCLKNFENSLKAHLAEEFCSLYLYMEYSTHEHRADEDHARLCAFKREMQFIGRQLIDIINKYKKDSVDSIAINGLISDFSSMRHILVDRIQREEAILYPMYDIYGTSYNADNRLAATG